MLSDALALTATAWQSITPRDADCFIAGMGFSATIWLTLAILARLLKSDD